MPSKILKCTCVSAFQDKEYGKDNRVMNHAPSKGAKPTRYRCTTCRKETESREVKTTIVLTDKKK